MNQTQIDYLFPITTALPERGSSNIARGDGELPDFGNHLAEASATTSNLPSTSEFRPADYRPDCSTTATGATNCRMEQAEDNASETSAAADSADSDVTDDTPHAAMPSVASDPPIAEDTESETAECEPNFDAAPEAIDAIPDDAHNDESDETTAIVVTVAPPVCIFVAEVPAEQNTDAAADATQPATSAAEEQPRGTTRLLDESSSLPIEKHHFADTLQDASPLTRDPLIAPAATSIEASGPVSAPRNNKVDDNGPSSAVDKKSKKVERSAKRPAAAARAGDPPSQNVAKTAAESKQPAEEVVVKIAPTEGESALEQPTDQSQPDGLADRANSKSDAPAAAKKLATAVANGLATPPNPDAPDADPDKDSSGKVSKANGPAKNEEVAAAIRSTRTNIANRRGTKSAAETDEVSRVDPARFVGRVANAIQTAHERGSSLQLRLSPPELGSVKLALTVKDGIMTAALETETTSARRVLLDHLPALRERLAAQNIRIERFDVDVQRENSGGRPDSQASQQQQQQQQQSRGHSPPRHPAGTRQPVTSTAQQNTVGSQPALSSSGINVVA